jgi:hypothetical protein
MSYRNPLYLFTPNNLTDAATINWVFDCNPAFVSISASRTLSITGPVTGHPTELVLAVTHTVAGTTLTLPGDSDHVNWAEGAGQTTLLRGIWTGSAYIWSSNVAGAAVSSGTALSTPVLTMTPVGDTELAMSWTNVNDEDGYTVELYSDAGYTSLVDTATKAADVTTHSFTGLTADTLYYGRVKAEGTTPFSDSSWGTDSATTGAAPVYLDWWNRTANLDLDYTAGSGGPITAPSPLNGIALNGNGTTSGWNTNYAHTSDTFTVGEYFQWDMGLGAQDTSRQKVVGFTGSNTFNNLSQFAFGLSFATGGTLDKWDGTAATAIGTYTATDHFKVVYGTKIEIWQSTDGASWTKIAESVGNATGTYYAAIMFNNSDSYIHNTVKG